MLFPLYVVCFSLFCSLLQDIVLLDVGQGEWMGRRDESILVPVWSGLTSVDLSHNHIASIDESVVCQTNCFKSNIIHFYQVYSSFGYEVHALVIFCFQLLETHAECGVP